VEEFGRWAVVEHLSRSVVELVLDRQQVSGGLAVYRSEVPAMLTQSDEAPVVQA